MKCFKCQSDVPVNAQFCPKCSSVIAKEVKSPSEVSAEWLKTILEAQEYEVKVKEDDPHEFFAASNSLAPNFYLSFLPDLKLIQLRASFPIKKVGWGKRSRFLWALNKANGSHRFFSFWTGPSMDHIYAQTGIYLTEQISNHDFAEFISRNFAQAIYLTFQASGLNEFI